MYHCLFAEDESDFAGIYTAELTLPRRCWGDEGHKVYFHSEHGSFVDLVSVDTATKQVKYLTGFKDDDRKGTFVVLDVSEGVIVAKYSNLSTAPELVSIVSLNSSMSTWLSLVSLLYLASSPSTSIS